MKGWILVQNTEKVDLSNVQMIAHRGVSGLERENTNAAFVAAGNRSYYGIETDVHRTKDGHYVIFHDDNMLRLTGIDCNLEECTLEELREITLMDADGKNRSDLVIPTLEEYIRICKKYGKRSILELKNHFDDADIKKIIKLIKQEDWLEQTVFISFVLENLIAVRQILPKQKIQYLVGHIDAEVLHVLKKYALDADVHYEGLLPDAVRAVHEVGQQVNVWTVNQPKIATKMAAMGVDFITTDILE